MNESNQPPAWLPAGAEDRSVSVDGVRFRYVRAGSGPPLLLVHGLLGYSFSFRYNLEPLGQHFTVYAPDLPGTGYSERPAHMDCSLSAAANRLARFLEVHGIGDFYLLGSSHGGALSIALAAQLKTRVRKLILVSPANPWSRYGRLLIPFFATRFGGKLLRFVERDFPRLQKFGIRRMYGDPRRISPGTLEGYVAPIRMPGTGSYVASIMRCWREDFRRFPEWLAQIQDIPTLLMWGDRDRNVLPDSAAELRQRLPKSEFLWFRGVAHLPYEEVPDLFNSAALDFLLK